MDQPLGGTQTPLEQIDALSAVLVAAAVQAGLTISAAESLTGGLVCDAIVRTPGASKTFRGGVVAYVNEVKVATLGVDRALLRREGAVAEEVAVQMAVGVATRLGADVGLATTGLAGPGEQGGLPAGTVHIAAVRPGGQVLTEQLLLAGSRSEIRSGAAIRCLELALLLF